MRRLLITWTHESFDGDGVDGEQFTTILINTASPRTIEERVSIMETGSEDRSDLIRVVKVETI